MDKLNLEAKLSIGRNDKRFLEIEETLKPLYSGMQEQITKYVIDKNRFVEDLIYKNLETSVLQEMKLKIEQELLDRKMRDEHSK